MIITYDVTIPPRNAFNGGMKSEEVLAIEAFLEGTQKNMCFTYDDDAEAKRKLSTISGWRKRYPQSDLIDSFRSGSRIFIVRLSPKEVRERRAARKETNNEQIP